MNDGYWFKPKTYGYGATPSNWKGWVATSVFASLTLAVTMVLMVVPAVAPGGQTPFANVALWAALTAALVAGFVVLSRSKTEGEWRWRWGDKE